MIASVLCAEIMDIISEIVSDEDHHANSIVILKGGKQKTSTTNSSIFSDNTRGSSANGRTFSVFFFSKNLETELRLKCLK